MKKRTEKRTFRLSYWLWLVWAILFVIFLSALYLYHSLAMRNLKKQTVDHMEQLLVMHAAKLDSSLSGLETYLNQSFSGSVAITLHETAGKQYAGGNLTDADFASVDSDIRQARYQIAVEMKSILGWDDSVDFLFFCAPSSFETRVLSAGSSSSEYSDAIVLSQTVEEYIVQRYESGELLTREYMIIEVNERCYVIRLYKVRNSYFGICMKTETILEAFDELTDDEESVAFIADLDGRIITSRHHITEQIDISRSGEMIVTDNGNYLVMFQLSDRGDFYTGLMTKEAAIERQLGFFKTLILLFSIGMLVGFPIIMWFLSQTIYKPVQNLAQGMKKVGDGDWETAVHSRTSIKEYKMLEQTFNQMVGEVKDLKINVYERELDARKFQLQCLQLQVNPHFYLNTYNVIYSLAEVRDYEMIQNITMSLVAYSRYMFKEASRMVTVKEELRHVFYYIELQKMRMFDNIEYIEDVSIEIEEALIPPFVIQTFIENCFKYAVHKDRKNRLSITGSLFEDEDKEMYVRIHVHDNGPGYNKSVIEMFQDPRHIEKDPESNIGIYNALQRIRMQFGDKGSIKLYNDKGASAVIDVPLLFRDENMINDKL